MAKSNKATQYLGDLKSGLATGKGQLKGERLKSPLNNTVFTIL